MIRRALTAAVDLWRIRRDPVAWARSRGVRIGQDCRLLGLARGTFGSEPYLVTLGNHVTVTAECSFITHDGGVWVFRREHPDIDVLAPIVVGDNVFLGARTLILPGVTIGSDCVIGAGSVVTKDIPAGHVAVGVPCRPLKPISDYWDSIRSKAMMIRGLSPDEKRRRIEAVFR